MVVSSGLPITLSSPPLPLNRLPSSLGAPVRLRMDEDQHAELLRPWPRTDGTSDRPAPAPSTLPPMAAPRSPYFLTASSSCWAARSGCCSATEAKATKRSGCAAQNSASFSFCMRDELLRRRRGRPCTSTALMLSASTSMPCSSMARRRSAGCDMSSAGVRDLHGPAAPSPRGRAVRVDVDRLHPPAVHDHVAARGSPRTAPARAPAWRSAVASVKAMPAGRVAAMVDESRCMVIGSCCSRRAEGAPPKVDARHARTDGGGHVVQAEAVALGHLGDRDLGVALPADDHHLVADARVRARR